MNNKWLKVLIALLVVGLVGESVYLVKTQKRLQTIEEKVSSVPWLEPQLSSHPKRVPPPHLFADSTMWDPFDEMEHLQKEIDRMFRDSFGRGLHALGKDYFGNMISFDPRVDLQETDTEYIIKMDIPGMSKDSIHVEVKDGVLIVSGKRENEWRQEKKGRFYRRERSFGSFSRAISLPQDAQADKVTATYKNGVLTVRIAKGKPSGPKEEKTKTINVI